MALSDDQKAMLRLLAQREQGYDDLAALMGLSVEEVRAKVKDALAQLEQQGVTPPPPPVEVPPPPPPAPGAAVEPAAPEPSSKHEPAAEPAPAVSARPAGAERPAPAAPKAPAAPGAPPRPGFALPKSSGARAAIAAGVAVIGLVIVVLLVSGEDSGDSGAPAGGSTTAAGEATSTAAANPKLTQAVLGPVDGGDAQGLATFGRVKDELALQIEAGGLAPTEKGQSYTIWLYESPQKMLPLASTRVPESGRIGAQVQVPTEVLAYLANETFDQIDVSLTVDAALKASLAKATREKEAPGYTGTDVLRGPITGPIIGAADKK
jgi:hypothetical protein